MCLLRAFCHFECNLLHNGLDECTKRAHTNTHNPPLQEVHRPVWSLRLSHSGRCDYHCRETDGGVGWGWSFLFKWNSSARDGALQNSQENENASHLCTYSLRIIFRNIFDKCFDWNLCGCVFTLKCAHFSTFYLFHYNINPGCLFLEPCKSYGAKTSPKRWNCTQTRVWFVSLTATRSHNWICDSTWQQQ